MVRDVLDLISIPKPHESWDVFVSKVTYVEVATNSSTNIHIMSTRSLLERLEELCNVDVDDVDTELIKSLPFKPHNRKSHLRYHSLSFEKC